MPRRSKLRSTRSKGRKSAWKIEVPARYSPTGKRQRHFFDTKDDADNFAETEKIRIANFGTSSFILPPSLQEQAAAAFETLKPYGATLNEVVQDWVSRKKASEATKAFGVASELYKADLKRRKIRGRPVSDAYNATVRQTFSRFSSLDKTLLTNIDARKLAEACEGMTPSVKNTSLAILSAFFGWCMQTPRHWIAVNPAATVPRESTGGKEVETFSPADVKKVLATCTDDDLLAYHAIGFFAGIRPEELERTEWQFINLAEKVIVLPADVTKTGKRRVIEITDTLTAWLKWIMVRRSKQRGEIVSMTKAAPNGPIISTVNLRRRLRKIREIAKVDWIQDGMRHSYASNWLSERREDESLSLRIGQDEAPPVFADEGFRQRRVGLCVREAERSQ